MSGPQAHGLCLLIKNGAVHLAEHNESYDQLDVFLWNSDPECLFHVPCVYFFEQKRQAEKSFKQKS